jgi:hypothetical protein
MKKTLIILYSILVASPCFAQYTNEYPLTMEQPRFYSNGYHQPDYMYSCIDPADKTTCFYRRSHGVPEKNVISSGVYRIGNNGKKTKIYGGKDKIIIKPLYLNLSGKAMTKDEIARIEKLSEAKQLERKKEEDARKEKSVYDSWF